MLDFVASFEDILISLIKITLISRYHLPCISNYIFKQYGDQLIMLIFWLLFFSLIHSFRRNSRWFCLQKCQCVLSPANLRGTNVDHSNNKAYMRSGMSANQPPRRRDINGGGDRHSRSRSEKLVLFYLQV